MAHSGSPSWQTLVFCSLALGIHPILPAPGPFYPRHLALPDGFT